MQDVPRSLSPEPWFHSVSTSLVIDHVGEIGEIGEIGVLEYWSRSFQEHAIGIARGREREGWSCPLPFIYIITK